jgi:hypothetical protein
MACSGDIGGGSDEIATNSSEIVSPVVAHFSQVLRVAANETTIRNICELTITLSSYTPLTITGAGRVNGTLGTLSTVNWTGNAGSQGGLSVNGCFNYPCDVVARWRGTGAMGSSTYGCEVTTDDGTGNVVGNSTGTGLTYMPFAPAEPAPVVYSQDMRLGPGGKIAGACAFRPSTQIGGAAIDQFQVFANGVSQLGPSTFLIGDAEWSTNVADVPFGSVYVGYEAAVDVTRMKHVTPLKEQRVAGDALRCEGIFYRSVSPMFIVFGDSGLGMSLIKASPI